MKKLVLEMAIAARTMSAQRAISGDNKDWIYMHCREVAMTS
jgi:hypothetical protein